ncbi:oleate hydratase [Halomonas halocynthiae]|uniref:oleate hydratase n=1 Tax=Halomonas halocynthiae TaxID=176290 RepID=UPI000413BF27|nr:oleate hydratase [Halomonas halocynthiae]
MTKTNTGATSFAALRAHLDASKTQKLNVTPDASTQHLHNGRDTLLPPADLHGTYVNHRPLPTEGVEKRHAFIVGSGIAGLSAAFFLIRDGHMPAENITILEGMKVDGGALDGTGNAEDSWGIVQPTCHLMRPC